MKPRCSVFVSALILFGGTAAITRAESLFVGTYNNTTSRGIYALQFDPASGELSEPVFAATTANSSFLTVSADHQYLYTEEEAAGQVAAFRIGPGSARLTLLNRQSARGQTTAHVSVDPSGRIVMAANYDSGSFCAFAVNPDGSLGSQSALFTDHGATGPDKRQDHPHAHAVTFSPDGHFAAVCDLGMDRVSIYQVKTSRGQVTATVAASAAVPPGAGPRHSVFSPDGRFLYAINELVGSVSVFSWDRRRPSLTLRETVSSLAPGYHGDAHSAEIAIDRAGRFLYASNRGPNDIAVFARNPENGSLTLIANQSYRGENARDFVLSPDGGWLISANEDSNELVVFRLDSKTGRISPTGHRASIALPACVAFK
jgi:6-phosphogluconolactonase